MPASARTGPPGPPGAAGAPGAPGAQGEPGTGITAYYAEHLPVIESGDTAGVLDGSVDDYDAASYPIAPVSFTVDVPLHGGVQFYLSVDAGWLDPPDNPGDETNGSFATVRVATIAPGHPPRGGGLAPVPQIN